MLKGFQGEARTQVMDNYFVVVLSRVLLVSIQVAELFVSRERVLAVSELR